MSKDVDVGKAFSDAIALFKGNFGTLVLSTLLAGLIGSLTCGILYAPMFVGLFLIIDRLIKNDPEKPTAGDVFKGMGKFAPSFICFILFAVVYAIACAVPVIGPIAAWITSPLLMFALIYITFEDMDAIAAIKRVFKELFSGELLMPVLIGILAGLAGGIGVIACGIGVIFTMPITSVIYIITYYQMKGGKDDILDADIVPSDESTTGETQPDAVPPPQASAEPVKSADPIESAEPAADEKPRKVD